MGRDPFAHRAVRKSLLQTGLRFWESVDGADFRLMRRMSLNQIRDYGAALSRMD